MHVRLLGVLALTASIIIGCGGGSSEEPTAARLIQLLEIVREGDRDGGVIALARGVVAHERFREICDSSDLPASLSSPCSNGLLAADDRAASSALYCTAFEGFYGVVSRASASALNRQHDHDGDVVTFTAVSSRVVSILSNIATVLEPSPTHLYGSMRAPIEQQLALLDSTCEDATLQVSCVAARISLLELVEVLPHELPPTFPEARLVTLERLAQIGAR